MSRRAHILYTIAFAVLGTCAFVQHLAGRTSEARSERTAESAIVPDGTSGEALLIPVAGVKKSELRDSFGSPRVGHKHSAIDILAARGTPVLATVSGTVLKLFRSRAGGLTIYLADANGATVYYYAHLDRYADNLHAPMHVAQGEILGFVGTTGNATPDRPHLHFGIAALPASGKWWKGKAVDPYPILMQRGTTTPATVQQAATERAEPVGTAAEGTQQQ